MTRIRNRAALLALPLALGTLAVGASSASADTSYQWGDNGNGACNAWQSGLNPSMAGTELGTYCMQAVTGWIQIGGGATQEQAISCSNNAPGGSPGLSYSLDGQAYVNAPEWYAVAVLQSSDGDAGSDTNDPQVAWQTGTYNNQNSANLSPELYDGSLNKGSNTDGSYGSYGAAVTNWGGNGGWQAALACKNAAGSALAQGSRVRRGIGPAAAPVRIADKKIDAIDKAKGRGLLVREYALKKNVTRTDTRTCPAGMVRRGKLAYTVQEFPAENKFSWKNRSLVDVKMTAKRNNAGSVKMTLKRAKNPTVVQFQMRCGKR